MEPTVVTKCPLCQSTNRRVLYKGTNQPGSKGMFEPSTYLCTSSGYGRFPDIMACLDCSLYYLSERPPAKTLEAMYSGIEDQTYLKEEAGRIKTFGEAMKDLNKYCPSKGKMFEFGSYTGVYLELAQKQGWTVMGGEFSTWARGIALNHRGIKLVHSDDDLPPSLKGDFDAVVMWDVIEHVTDPVDMIDRAARLLKKGGVIGLSTMVLDSLSARILKDKYPFLMEMHMIYFTEKTLLGLLKSRGFEILECKRHARYVSAAYMFNKIPALTKLTQHPVIGPFLHKNFVKLSVGLRDVYARKK
jgi:SAM-dependent methyltransferase